MVRGVVILMSLMMIGIPANAQDVRLLRRIAQLHEQKATQEMSRPANYFQSADQTESRLLLASIVRLYQILVSSQDADMCAYEPSCSRFGLLSMNQFGVAKGFLLTADRLTRCNGLTDSRHEVNQETGKFIDPVDRYAPIISTHR